jgi:hypothetical protein
MKLCKKSDPDPTSGCLRDFGEKKDLNAQLNASSSRLMKIIIRDQRT